MKYVLDISTKHHIELERDHARKDDEHNKKCAKEVALAVARNWNPGLTLTQQKDAVMKVADAVYNVSITHNDSVLGRAIPGLDIKKDHQIVSNSTFGGIVVDHSETTSAAAAGTINYITAAKYTNRYSIAKLSGSYTLWNPNFAMWRSMDKGTDPENRVSIFDEIDEAELERNNFVLIHQDIYTLPCLAYIGHICKVYPATNGLYYPNNSYHSPSCSSDHARFYLTMPSIVNSAVFSYHPINVFSSSATAVSSTSSSTYKKRVEPVDTSVQVFIDGDRIKAQTKSDTGYAVPAECNVDIVLAVPVCGSANNASSRDSASDVAGTPPDNVTASTSIPATITSTPIYQIGQACKNFVKDNFYHIRGLNMGLIPYSGKVSISPDKISYTTAIPPFNSAYFSDSNVLNNSDLRNALGFMRGSFLYGTRGEKGASLTQSFISKALVSNEELPTTNTPYVWGGVLTGCPLMCRRGVSETSATYGNNQIAYGDLLSTSNPNTPDQQFQRMNLNPCYLGYANLLSMKCERDCTTYLPNPYYIIELTADVHKIYELCNALYPIYDLHNVSNFIFIAVTWANNLFQSWTNNPVKTASNTDGGGQLSLPSKTTSGCKKALILIVNKPDYFEPNELTYLGFNNDFSEIPMIESDCIRFDVDYSDTTRKFADGTPYDGTIQGAKKIIKYTTTSGTVTKNPTSGFYETTGTTSATGRLSFPQKGLLKVVVESKPSLTWKKISSLSSFFPSGWDNLLYKNGTWIARNGWNIARSTDNGYNWALVPGSTFPEERLGAGELQPFTRDIGI